MEKGGSLRILGGPISAVSRGMRRAKATVEDLISKVVEAVETSGSMRMALRRVDLLPLLPPKGPDIRVQRPEGEVGGVGCTSVLTSEIREGSGS